MYIKKLIIIRLNAATSWISGPLYHANKLGRLKNHRPSVKIYRYSVIVFNNIIIPLVLVGCKIIETKLAVRESLAILYLIRVKEMTVNIQRTRFTRE